MAVILRWFEEFPKRALQLLEEIEPQARALDRLESLSLLVAPSLIVAPFERLRTHWGRKNRQEDYRAFPEAHESFAALIALPFHKAPFWGGRDAGEWRGASVPTITRDPGTWRSKEGRSLKDTAFWTDDVRKWSAERVLKHLRDALAHWNIATSDRTFQDFTENATMEQFILYRAGSEDGPWDVIAVSTSEFFQFLKAWTQYWSEGAGQEALAATLE